MVSGKMVLTGIILTFVAVSLSAEPLPGIPMALTCDTFDTVPDLGLVTVIDNWNAWDRIAVVFVNDTGSAIQIAGVQGYLAHTHLPMITQMRIWEVRDESILPNVPGASLQVSGVYDIAFDPVPGNPDVALGTINLETYPGLQMPVINPGKTFVVDFINVNPSLSMKFTAEAPGRCPPAYWSDETNIFGYLSGASTVWNFKEDIGEPTNYYIGITYFPDATPRVPAMGPAGIAGLLIVISLGIIKRKRSRG